MSTQYEFEDWRDRHDHLTKAAFEDAYSLGSAPLLSRIAELEKQLQGERQLRQESEGMGLCMSMVHDDLVQAGVIPAGTAPMFITEAVLSRIDALSKDADPVAWVSTVQCIGPDYGKELYGKLPVQSLQAGYYKHTPLYLGKQSSIDAAISEREGE